jgi:hypothetical protein
MASARSIKHQPFTIGIHRDTPAVQEGRFGGHVSSFVIVVDAAARASGADRDHAAIPASVKAGRYTVLHNCREKSASCG